MGDQTAAALTPGAAASLCARLYETDDGWDFITRPNASVVLAITGSTIVCRGSDDALDWLHDAVSEFFRDLVHHPQLGPLPLGFAAGIEASYAAVRARLPHGPVRLTGHSLGAAHAAILAGLFVLDGIIPLQVLLFGCPRPGMAELARAVAPIPDWRSFRNAPGHVHDIVTDVPTHPPFNHPRLPLIDIAEYPPPGSRGLDPYHSIKLYEAGANAIA